MKKMLPGQTPRLHQFMFEAESWARLLLFCKDELLHLKSRLDAVLEEDDEEAFRLVAERFGDEFLAQDKVFQYLSDELNKQTNRLQKDRYVDGELFKEIARCQVRLRREIKKGEALFAERKNKFDHYLNERYAVDTGS